MPKSTAAQTRARNKKMVSDAQASTRGSTSNRLVKDLEFLKFSLDRLQADRKRSAIKTQRIKNKKLEIKLIEEELANRKRVEERRARRIKNEEYFERVAPRDPELKRMIAIEKRDAEKALRERDVYGRNFRRMKWRSSKPGIASKGRRDRRRHMIEAIKSAEWSDKHAITGSHPAVASFYDHMNQVRGKDRTQVKKELKKKGLLKSGFVAAYFR